MKCRLATCTNEAENVYLRKPLGTALPPRRLLVFCPAHADILGPALAADFEVIPIDSVEAHEELVAATLAETIA
jgi:hypothetical protein